MWLTLIMLILLESFSCQDLARSYKCEDANSGESCSCVFPFIYEGVTYDSCTDKDEEDLWCATSVDSSNQYIDYGWCRNIDKPESSKAEKLDPVAEKERQIEDVCTGKCGKANQKCSPRYLRSTQKTRSGMAVCECLEGYLDQSSDGSGCQCVTDWSGEGVDMGTGGEHCQPNDCTVGYEYKEWRDKETKKEKVWCHREMAECDPAFHDRDPDLPNIDRIGKGYNILVGNLLEIPKDDILGHEGFKGLHKQIFSPYSVSVRDRERCKVNGYEIDISKNCRASLKTTIFTSSSQVRENIEEKVNTGEFVEEFTFSVSEGENAQFSHSVSFGESFSQSSDSTGGTTSNHCVDKSVSQSTDRGSSVDTSKTSEQSTNFEVSQSESRNEEKSSTNTDTTTISQTESNQFTQEKSESSEVSTSVSAGAFGATATASASHSSSSSESKTQSNEETRGSETSNEESFTTGKNTENSYSRDNSRSDSSTSSVGITENKSNQKSISTNICREESKTETNTNSNNKDENETNEQNKASSFEKSFQIPGDSRAVEHSTAVAKAEEFFQEFSGTISHTEATCEKYTARLNERDPPAFTKTFKDFILEMDSLTEELWDTNVVTEKLNNGTLISYKNEANEKIFDEKFYQFIELFGTHYIKAAKMGGVQRIKYLLKSFKTDKENVDQTEKCLNMVIKEKRGENKQDGNNNDDCKDKDIEQRVKSALEESSEEVITYGAGANKNIYDWTDDEFDNPTLLPEFKLQPIVKLFTLDFMKRDRISRKDGKLINFKRILSWLLPRYNILIGRCKLMKNHHISEGKTCIPNLPWLTSTRDGNDQIDLAGLCKSLPNVILLPGENQCTFCPDGVNHGERRCKTKTETLFE